MGQKLMKIFEYVQEKGGRRAMFRTALKAAMLPKIAERAPDTPENIEKLTQAAKVVLGVDSIPV